MKTCSLGFYLAFGVLLQGDTLTLRNGTKVDGSFIGGDNHSVRFAVGSQVNTYYLNDITTISFGGSAGSATATPPQEGASVPPDSAAVRQQPSTPGTASGSTSSAPGANSQRSTVTAGLQVPSGAELMIRLIDAVNSETDSLGQTYRASVDEPVTVNGQTVIPRGADAVVTLIDAQKSGKIEGKTILTLDLKSVTTNGRSYDVVTTGVPQESVSRGARSTKVIGGTAALGAIIGAIAGGGKGAAIGAGSGAAVGTAAQVMTSGQKVKVPSETRITFVLQNALTF